MAGGKRGEPSAVGNDRVSHVFSHITPQRHGVRIHLIKSSISISSQSPYKQPDTYRMALGRSIEPRTRYCRVKRKCVQPYLICVLGSIALAALGGEGWKRSKARRCNSL